MNNFGVLNNILVISWQFLGVFFVCFWAVFLYFGPFCWRVKAIFCFSPQFTNQSYFPKISKMPILTFYLFVHLIMFHPALLVPVERVMPIFRGIKTDHDLGLHVVLDIIIFMANHSNLGVTNISVFLWHSLFILTNSAKP